MLKIKSLVSQEPKLNTLRFDEIKLKPGIYKCVAHKHGTMISHNDLARRFIVFEGTSDVFVTRDNEIWCVKYPWVDYLFVMVNETLTLESTNE